MKKDLCPNCKMDFQGDPIPKDIVGHYAGTHWSLKIGLENPKYYDGVAWWKCPGCDHIWGRFPWSPKWGDK